MERPPSLLPYVYCATSFLIAMTTTATAAIITVNVTHLCDTRPAIAAAATTATGPSALQPATAVGMTTSLSPPSEDLTTRPSSSPAQNLVSWPSPPPTENPTTWPSPSSTENLTTRSSSPPTQSPTSWLLSPSTENFASPPSPPPTENLTSRLSSPPPRNPVSWLQLLPSAENLTTRRSSSPPTQTPTGPTSLLLSPSTENLTFGPSPPPTENHTSRSSSLSSENPTTALSPSPTDNRTSSGARITEFLFAIRKPGIMGFTYASRTAVRRSSSSPNASAGPVALEQIAAFPSAKFRENVKLDQQTSGSDDGPGSGAAAAIGLFGVGIVVGDVGLRFIGVAENVVMWHSVPAELVLDLFGNAYEWDVVAKKTIPAARG